MATGNSRTPEEIRLEIETQRDQLATAVDTFRAEISEATNVKAKLREKLPVAALGALGAGFVLAGGIGATVRLLTGTSREEEDRTILARLRLSGRDD